MRKVLVIDDNVVVRNTLKRVLEEAGFGVVIASNGLEGFQIFQRQLPDVVVTDLIMPEQEGIATIRQILGADSKARIIAITGAGCAGHLDLLSIARRFGAAAVLRKPFQPEELIAAIHKLKLPDQQDR